MPTKTQVKLAAALLGEAAMALVDSERPEYNLQKDAKLTLQELIEVRVSLQLYRERMGYDVDAPVSQICLMSWLADIFEQHSKG